MNQVASNVPRRALAPAILAGALVGLVLAATIGLWFHYGTTVFFEIIRSGLAACF